MKVKEIAVSYTEKRVVDYNSEAHSTTLVADITEEDLEERPIQQWGYYLDNVARDMVKNMFGDGFKKIELSPEDIDKRDQRAKEKVEKEKGTPNADLEDTIYNVEIIRETGKAYQLEGELGQAWIPKSTVATVEERKDDRINIKLTEKAQHWLPDKMEWK
jgi:hypothetical protein